MDEYDRPNTLHGFRTCELATDEVATLTIKTAGPSGHGIWVDWGDRTGLEWITHAGIGTPVTTAHDYSATTATKKLIFSGDLNAMNYFWCEDGNLKGVPRAFAMLPGLTTLHLKSYGGSGDLDGIARCTSLTSLSTHYSSMTQTMSKLAPLTGLTYLFFRNATGISGNVSDLAALTSLATLDGRTTAIGVDTGALPAWSGCSINFTSCNWTQGEVDNFLIYLAAGGGSNGTASIAGTNAARSAASDAAKATLLGNGWAITVNE